MINNSKGFTTKEVLDYARISARQLRWWEEKGIFKSSISRNRPWQRRRYTLEDLICILVIKSLLDRGISLFRIRKSVERAKLTGIDNPLAKFRVACLANSVIFKKGKNYIDPISGQMIIEQVVDTIRPRLKQELHPDIDMIVKEAENHFIKIVGAF